MTDAVETLRDGDSEQGEATFRELREYASGSLDVDHSDVYPWAALVDDPEMREVLAFMQQHYDPVDGMPSRFIDTEFFEAAIRKFGTEAATRAVRDSQHSLAAHISGLPSYQSDISGLHAINRLASWLTESEQCKLIYLAALMGRGKTDFALTMFDIIEDHYRRIRESTATDANPRPEFAANFFAEPPSGLDCEFHEFHNYDEFETWAERGSSDDIRWFIFDEASTELTAQSGSNAQDVAEVFAPFVKKMRKCGINMICIGHDRGDIHPAIRSIASFIDKTDLKTARLYDGISSREPEGFVTEVSGIPQTRWEFSTDDSADWSWGESLDDDGSLDISPASVIPEDEWRRWRDDALASVYRSTDHSEADVAEMFGFSQGTVNSAKQRSDASQELPPEKPAKLSDKMDKSD